MSSRVCVIDMPGLSRQLLGQIPGQTALGAWLASRRVRDLAMSFPAVTCSAQATLTTGVNPVEHGIIANGLPMFRYPEDQALVDAGNFAGFRRQISFWEQSNQFLQRRRFWQEDSGRSLWKTALICMQHSMPGFAGVAKPAADIVLTPKPEHGPDGKLTSLCWSEPGDLAPRLSEELGPFPLMNYWGPMASIASSQWIAKAGASIWRGQQPQLQWVYLPHLDYDLQRFGPGSARAKAAVVELAAAVEPLLAAVLDGGGKIVLLSEYTMQEVSAVVQPNRILADNGLLQTRQTEDGKIVDYERSAAFAMVDHQIAHVYVKDAGQIEKIRRVLQVEGVESVSPPPQKSRHRRAGDLVMVAREGVWCDYRWWRDVIEAPVFAKMVDIHRKPGYDALELFWDRQINGVSQNPGLIHGSHGIASTGQGVWVSHDAEWRGETIAATEAAGIIAQMMQ